MLDMLSGVPGLLTSSAPAAPAAPTAADRQHMSHGSNTADKKYNC